MCLVSHRLCDHVHDIESSLEETGALHILPNKGGLAVSLFIGDTSLCFVSSHLAANEGYGDRRCEDYAEIIDGILLGCENKPLTNQFTHVIWVGDLNFRIDMGDEECNRLVNSGDWKQLYEHDELNKVQKQEKAFYMFNEGELQFPPTYKHIPGSPPDVTTGRRAYKLGKGHTPSWCDRVLWRSFPDTELELLPNSYQSTPTICTSDHSPVSAVFHMTVPKPRLIFGEGAIATKPPLIITGTKLRARGLQLMSPTSPMSDPFVVFLSRCSDDAPRTGAQKKTVDPEWTNETLVLKAKPCFSEPEDLLTWHVLVSVVEAASADTMGHGVVSLKAAASAPGQSQPFVVRLSRSGVPAGILEGEVSVQEGPIVNTL